MVKLHTCYMVTFISLWMIFLSFACYQTALCAKSVTVNKSEWDATVKMSSQTFDDLMLAPAPAPAPAPGRKTVKPHKVFIYPRIKMLANDYLSSM